MKVVFDDDHKVAISRICGRKGSLVIVYDYESMAIYVVDINLSPIGIGCLQNCEKAEVGRFRD